MWLVMRGVIPDRDPATVRSTSEALQVPVADLREAWYQLERRGYRPPSAAGPDWDNLRTPQRGHRGPQAPRPEPSDQHARASRQTQRWGRANPEPGMRRCSRCGETLPVDRFPWKDRAKGLRRSYDAECWKAMQRERYLSVQKERCLNQVGLTFVLTEGDELGSLACADCGVPLKAGDEVHGAHVSLRHTDCQSAEVSDLHRRTA